MKTDSLTMCEKEILECIIKYIDLKGYSPSVREIGRYSGRTSPATVQAHLNNLKDKGYITWVTGQNRTIRVIKREG